MAKLSKNSQAIQNHLNELGYTNKVKQLPDSTRTAEEAANALECEIAQIAKSIIFRLKESGKPLLVIASGVNRVNEKQVEKHLEEKLGRADAEFVRKHTGFAIGGVPPLGHVQPIKTFIDEDLLELENLWAAAGHPKAVFPLTSTELVDMTNGQVINIK